MHRYNASLYTNATHRFHWGGGLCGLRDITVIHIYTTLLILLAIISTIENLVVLVIICKNKVLRTPSLLLLGVLAGIDFVTGCIVTPIKASLTQHPNLFENLVTVKAFAVLFLAVVIFSLSTVMLISFDRFCHVYFLENYNLTKTKMCIALFCCWIAPVVFIIILMSEVNIGMAGGVFAMVYFFACILAMIFAHIATVIVLKKHASNSYYAMQQDMIESQRKAVKTVLIIVVTFTAMNIPPILSSALSLMGVYSGKLCAITFFVMLANSAVNPLIYCFRIPTMKEKVLELFMFNQESSAPSGADEFRDISITDPHGMEFQNGRAVVVMEDENRGSTQPGAGVQNEAYDGNARVVATTKYVSFE